jgi:hypothetical protein
MDLDFTAARLRVLRGVERAHRLAGGRPAAPLPAKAAPAILDRLVVRPDDAAAEIMAGRPDPNFLLWTQELRWLLDRSIARQSSRGPEALRLGPHARWSPMNTPTAVAATTRSRLAVPVRVTRRPRGPLPRTGRSAGRRPGCPRIAISG